MQRIVWQPSMGIGVPFIDADHKILIDLINQVQDCMGERDEFVILASVLNALSDYTDHHFAREERLLKECGYDDLIAHLTRHRDLAGQVRNIYRRYETDRRSVRAGDVLEFLYSWLTDHIMHHDMAYKPFVLGNEGAAQAASGVSMAKAPGSSALQPDWGKLKVMLIEVNDHFTHLITTILNGVGVVDIVTVASGREGLLAMEKNCPNVVLCDSNEDDCLGFVIEMRNRDDFGFRHIPVIVLSASVDPVARDRAMAAGADMVMRKPIATREFLQALGRMAASSQAHS